MTAISLDWRTTFSGGNAAVGLRLYSQQEKTRKLTWLRESILSQWLFLGLKLRSKKVGFTYR
jgi:hypothetical protein